MTEVPLWVSAAKTQVPSLQLPVEATVSPQEGQATGISRLSHLCTAEALFQARGSEESGAFFLQLAPTD